MDLFESKSIDFLNFEEILETPYGVGENFSVNLKLSNNVHYHQRIVYDVLMMFGDVGGLNDFLVLLLAAIFGFFADKMMLKELASKLFHYPTTASQNPEIS